MKIRFRQIQWTLVLLPFVALFGCGETAQPTPTSTPAATPTTAQPVIADLDPTYEATLGEGIDFKKPGYPNFLAEVSGMSIRETWGRQTDANNGPAARFRFKKALPRKFTLEITANVFGPNIGEPIKVKVGQVEQTFVHKDPQTVATYNFVFELPSDADTIEIVPPKPTTPAELKMNTDSRKLGVSLYALKIRS